jgi:hypothetical protein
MAERTLRGSCLCGTVTFEVTGEERRFYHCHCKRCRKATGTGHASNLFLQPGKLTVHSGADLIRSFKPADATRFTNYFCGGCGGRVPRQIPGTDMVMVPAGSLDDEPQLKPQARIFKDSRASWSCEGDGLPAFSEDAPTS